MPPIPELEPLISIATHERATPSLVYRSLLRSLHDGYLRPGAKLPNERDIAKQLKTSRTAVRNALTMMERQGLVRRRVGSGTFVTEDASQIFDRMDQTNVGTHDDVPSFVEIIEGPAPVRAGDDAASSSIGSRRKKSRRCAERSTTS